MLKKGVLLKRVSTTIVKSLYKIIIVARGSNVRPPGRTAGQPDGPDGPDGCTDGPPNGPHGPPNGPHGA